MFQEGLGAKGLHTEFEKLHPAPFAYLDAERLIQFFSRKNERVLDPFVGIASTLKACALSGRIGLGIELNGNFVKLGRQRLVREVSATARRSHPQKIRTGDCRKVVSTLADDSVEFVLTSPPFWNILSRTGPANKYYKQSRSYGVDPRDFSLIGDYDEFVLRLAEFADSLKRILKPNRYMALVVSDFRNKSRLHAFHADLIREIHSLNRDGERQLVLQGITILAQNNKKLFPYGFPTTYVPNIHHQYVLIFRNMVRVSKTVPKTSTTVLAQSRKARPRRVHYDKGGRQRR